MLSGLPRGNSILSDPTPKACEPPGTASSCNHPHSTIQRRQCVQPSRHIRLPSVKPSTRPNPIRRAGHEAATNRVVVDVFDHRQQRAVLHHIAIISAASLPKAMFDLAIGLAVPKVFEK